MHGSLLEEVLRTSQSAYRQDMSWAEYPEEEEFIALGLRCRLATPLLLGARSIGMLSLVRREPEVEWLDGFGDSREIQDRATALVHDKVP